MKANDLERTTSTTSVHVDHQEFTINQPSQGSLYRRDGCRAWLVCLSAVLSNILIFGCTQTFGVIYPVLLDEFNEGKAKTAWVGSLAMAMSMTLSPVAAKLINRFGPRVVTIAGGMVTALGLFLTSLTTSIALMYCTYSFILGLGVSLAYTSNYDIVPRYFKRRLGLATGVMHAGAGAAFFVSLVIGTLITHVGWRNTFKAISGMALTVCICGVPFSLHVERDNEPSTHRRTMAVHERNALKLLVRNGRLIICCIFGFVFQFGNTIPLVHLGRHAQDSGLNLSQIAYLYVGFGVATVIGRLVSGRLCDVRSVNPSYILCFTALVAGVSTILCPLAKHFTGLLAYFFSNGICDGFYVTLITVLIIRNTHVDNSIQWLSIFLFVSSFGFAFGSPFGGFIADQAGSYVPVFYTSGSIVLCSAVVMMTFGRVKLQNGTTSIEREEDDLIVTEKLTVL